MTTQVNEREDASHVVVSDAAAHPTRLLIIQPLKGLVSLQLSELWKHREVLYFLIWRDIKGGYKQTALGAAWGNIQPLFTMVTFSIFFGPPAKVPPDHLPYTLFSYLPLLPSTL